jgi:hypothetical protein
MRKWWVDRDFFFDFQEIGVLRFECLFSTQFFCFTSSMELSEFGELSIEVFVMNEALVLMHGSSHTAWEINLKSASNKLARCALQFITTSSLLFPHVVYSSHRASASIHSQIFFPPVLLSCAHSPATRSGNFAPTCSSHPPSSHMRLAPYPASRMPKLVHLR